MTAALARQPANDNAKPRKPRFNIVRFDDVNLTIAKEYVVQGLMGAGEFSLFVAKPGTAKSVLIADIGLHVAAGKEWHGRKVKQGLVVFFAAERSSLTQRRVAAWRKQHSESGIPFIIVSGKLDLTTGLYDATDLANITAELSAEFGLPCRLVILDTVTRTFGPGDQNSSRDMTRFVQSVDELTRLTGAHVAAIHHSGWAGDRGKGAVDLDGAVDVSYGISVTGKGPTKVFKLECTGANDGEEGDITSFRLDSVELGTDADGNVTNAPVVVQVDPTKHDGSKLKGSADKALDSLAAILAEDGQTPPAGAPGFSDGVVVVTRDAWRNRFYADAFVSEPELSQDTLKKRFQRACKDDRVGECGQMVWLERDK